MQSVVNFFDLAGEPLAEFIGSTTREWKLSEPGVATFVYPRGDDLQERIIRPGNWVYISCAETLPWVGRISDFREWTFEGPKVKAYQPAIIFEDRMLVEIDANEMLIPPRVLEDTVTGILTQMISLANGMGDTRIRAGDSMYAGGASGQETLSQDFLSHLGYIIRRHGFDYDITADLSTGLLVLNMNVYQAKGIDTSNIFTLEESSNLELRVSTILAEQGKIINNFTGIGDGIDDELRMAARRVDAASAKRYGPRVGADTFMGVTQRGTLVQNVITRLDYSAIWHKTVRVSCNDSELFKYLTDGNSVHIILHSFGFLESGAMGFDETTRILSCEISDSDTSASLILRDI